MKSDKTDTTGTEPVKVARTVFYDKRGVEVRPVSVRAGGKSYTLDDWVIKQVTGQVAAEGNKA